MLLEHTTPATPTAPAGRHWDLLVEAPGAERLPTWRLADDPRSGRPVPATRVPDHRRHYLDYEGEISGGRGSVRRVDRGAAAVLRLGGSGGRIGPAGDPACATRPPELAQEAELMLAGVHLQGEYCITRSADGGLMFGAR